MLIEKRPIDQLHFEHRLWTNEVDFVKDEITIYEHRLEELVLRNDDKEMLAQLEHFQNQFIREKEVIDALLSDIKKHEQTISKEAREQGSEREQVFHSDHDDLRERMESFRSIYGDLKKEFYRFMAKWM